MEGVGKPVWIPSKAQSLGMENQMKINSDLVGLKWFMVLIDKNHYLVSMRENQSRPQPLMRNTMKIYEDDEVKLHRIPFRVMVCPAKP